MAETALTVVDAPGKWSATGLALAFAAVDAVNGNKIAAPADCLVVVRNTAGVAKTVTITGQPLAQTGRSGDASASLAAGEVRIFRLAQDGWTDANGNVLLPTGLDAALEVAVVKLT